MFKVEKKKELHNCSAFGLDVSWKDYRRLYGGAVFDCFGNDKGELVVTNDEYGNRVNYCPFCGYKAKKQMELKCEKGQKPLICRCGHNRLHHEGNCVYINCDCLKFVKKD